MTMVVQRTHLEQYFMKNYVRGDESRYEEKITEEKGNEKAKSKNDVRRPNVAGVPTDKHLHVQ